MQKAVDLVKEQKDKGQIRRFTGNDYADDLAAGNIVIAQAYSGDVVQLQADNPDLEFIVPESGGTGSSTPRRSRTPRRTSMPPRRGSTTSTTGPNYAKLVAFTQYVPVLSDMTDELNKIDPKLAANPLINPPQDYTGQAEDLGRAHRRADPGVQHRVRRRHRRLDGADTWQE